MNDDPITTALDLLRPELARATNEREWVRCSIADGPAKVNRYWAATMRRDALERAVFALEAVREMEA